ncbi:hypothetical protein FS749_010638 [Ceratobasidium sp. UAMH 11750]|nr:hypothetical protein FS749_010638 [Ceratobasidium sp. UAMH 11750]
MNPKSYLHYGPESLIYMRRRMTEHGLNLDRWQGLPPMPVQMPIVQNEQTSAWACEAAGNETVLVELVKNISTYEYFGPYQATRGDWERLRAGCILLNRELPDAGAGVDHLVHQTDDTGEQLPREMFDPNHPASRHWTWVAVLAWIDGDAFVHRSGTIMGGPYGWKWAVLILLLLFKCGSKIQDGQGPRYSDLNVQWSEGESSAVIKTATRLMGRIAKLVTVLFGSRAAREAARIDELRSLSGPSWDVENVDVRVIRKGKDEWTVSALCRLPGYLTLISFTKQKEEKASGYRMAARYTTRF